MLMGWAAKVLVEVVMLTLTYVVVRFLKDTEHVDHCDYGTRFNPLLLR
jgi:queuosine precursor transporter